MIKRFSRRFAEAISLLLLGFFIVPSFIPPAQATSTTLTRHDGSGTGPNKPTFPEKGRSFTATRAILVFNHKPRTYLIQTVPGSDLHPVVILLHGGGEDSDMVWRQTSLPTLAKENHFIIVAPNAIDKYWNDGRGATAAGDHPSTTDDVGFLEALIKEVLQKYHGDPDAVFMIGVANGGFMTMHFACRDGEMLRAAGTALANLTPDEAATCKTGKPLPWLMMNGTEDPLVPFNGQRAGMDEHGNPKPALLSAAATFDYYAKNAHCAPDLITESLPNIDPSDKSTAIKHIRSHCEGQMSSVQYIFKGAGHSWPGIKTFRAFSYYLGGINEDVDAGTAIWGFFSKTLH